MRQTAHSLLRGEQSGLAPDLTLSVLAGFDCALEFAQATLYLPIIAHLQLYVTSRI